MEKRLINTISDRMKQVLDGKTTDYYHNITFKAIPSKIDKLDTRSILTACNKLYKGIKLMRLDFIRDPSYKRNDVLFGCFLEKGYRDYHYTEQLYTLTLQIRKDSLV